MAGTHAIVSQVINSLRTKHLDNDEANKLRSAAVEALIGIKPKDEIEGMIAAQLVACHNASMECYRRAMLPNILFDMRHGNLNSANKLSADIFDGHVRPRSRRTTPRRSAGSTAGPRRSAARRWTEAQRGSHRIRVARAVKADNARS